MAERETVFVVTPESIDRYIQSLQERGRTAETVQNYRRSLAKLADVLGHSSIETTRIYLISTGDEHARVLERLRLIS